MNYTAGGVKKNGEVFGKAFETKAEAEEFILSIMEKEELKRARIKDLKTGIEEIII